jgi:chorismate dehydratase
MLREQFDCDGYEFVSGVPAALNALLAAGKIDVCPSSSFEYAVHSERYRILPQLSISSNGAVASVMLFSRVPIEELHGQTIQLSSESATSVNLLKILMAQRYSCSCRYTANSQKIADALESSPALLLIGDAALRASMNKTDLHVYDLGRIWRDWTGLPFVFALWLCRREVADDPNLLELSRRLILAKGLAPLHHARIVRHARETSWMSCERLLEYWRENISYDLEEQNITGLMTFFGKCYELGLITSVPALNFTAI